MRSYFPHQGSNPCPLQWKLRVPTTAPPGKSWRWIFLTVIGALFTLIKLFNLKFPLNLMIFWIPKKCLVCSCYFVCDWPLFQILSCYHWLIHLTNIQCPSLPTCQPLFLGYCDHWPDTVSTPDNGWVMCIFFIKSKKKDKVSYFLVFWKGALVSLRPFAWWDSVLTVSLFFLRGGPKWIRSDVRRSGSPVCWT